MPTSIKVISVCSQEKNNDDMHKICTRYAQCTYVDPTKYRERTKCTLQEVLNPTGTRFKVVPG